MAIVGSSLLAERGRDDEVVLPQRVHDDRSRRELRDDRAAISSPSSTRIRPVGRIERRHGQPLRAARSDPCRAPSRRPPWRTSSAASTRPGASDGSCSSSSRSAGAKRDSAKPPRSRPQPLEVDRRRGLRGLRARRRRRRECASETTGASRGVREPGAVDERPARRVRPDLDVRREAARGRRAAARARSRPPSPPCVRRATRARAARVAAAHGTARAPPARAPGAPTRASRSRGRGAAP